MLAALSIYASCTSQREQKLGVGSVIGTFNTTNLAYFDVHFHGVCFFSTTSH